MSAKEMFEKYGYELVNDDECELIYQTYSYPEYDDTEQIIKFDKICKTVTSAQGFSFNRPCEICVDELKIINKQVEELGWLGSDDNE